MKTKYFLVIFIAVLFVVLGCSDSKTTTVLRQTATVNIGLSTNDGGSVLGAVVRLHNNNGNPAHIYEKIAQGQTMNFSGVVFGTYTLSITHIGYMSHVVIDFSVQTHIIDRVAVLSAGTDYNIGDIGPAGGIIFHDKGFISGGWQYLEAAPFDSEFDAQWGAIEHNVFGTEFTTGTGRRNTERIVARLNQLSETGKAAQICHDLIINGFNDWFFTE